MTETNVTPLIAVGLNIETVGQQVTVFHSKTKKSYIFGEAEYKILLHMNGINSIEKLSELSGKYNIEQTRRLIEEFEKRGFLEGKGIAKKEGKGFIKAKKIGIINGNKYIKTDCFMTKLLYFIIVYLSIPILAMGAYQYYRGTYGFTNINLQEILNVSLIMHICSFIVIATLHEFAHAVVARKYHVPVPEIGLMFYIIIPYVYTNMSFISLLKRKRQRIICLLAGIMSNILLSGIAFFIAGLITGNSRHFFEEIAFMNLLLVITNLMIFFKLDGYFILQEIMGESNLRENSIFLVRKQISTNINKFFKRSGKEKVQYSIDKKETSNIMFYICYGLLCIGYVPVLLLSFLANLLKYFI